MVKITIFPNWITSGTGLWFDLCDGLAYVTAALQRADTSLRREEDPAVFVSRNTITKTCSSSEVPGLRRGWQRYIPIAAQMIDVVLDEDLVVRRDLLEHRLPSSILLPMAELDICNDTPFKPETVVPLLERFSCANAGKGYFLVKKQVFERLDNFLSDHSLKVRRIFVRHNSQVHRIKGTGALPIQLSVVGNVMQMSRRFFMSAMICLTIAAAVFIASSRVNARLYDLQFEINEIEPKARAARKIIDTSQERRNLGVALRARTVTNGDVLKTVEALTRTLPDDTFLTELKIADAKVEISGLSQSAASLPGLLQKSGSFFDVTFSSGIARAVGVDADRFSMSMRR
ncbi:PilN domain-containing protein [Allorhizobium undicola]|uniref:PilN domain-containing protein n=1 Tax=Allorhizobium undicola TaxID=78527 RepID=UPI000488659B|nr:PilN domain-containing protein [Allorhizobium undicola]